METLPLFTPAPPAPVPAPGAARPRPGEGGPAAGARRGAEVAAPRDPGGAATVGAASGACGGCEPGAAAGAVGYGSPGATREPVHRTAGATGGAFAARASVSAAPRPAVAPPDDVVRPPARPVPGDPAVDVATRPASPAAGARAAPAASAAALPAESAVASAASAAASTAGSTPQPGARPAAPAPEDLHPALWRAHQLGRQRDATWSSGFAALDAALPGAGWPARVLTELLLPRPGIGEMRLLAPALGAIQRDARSVMLFDPPALPFGAALADCGIALDRLFVVRNREARRGRSNGPLPAADILWAVEQTLRSGHVGAVLAWLPARLPAEALRRLQLAAQAHDGPAFVLREDGARSRPSVAPLRLWLCVAGADALRVHLLKRRGPPLAQPIVLALPPVLAAAARERARAPVAAPAVPAAALVLDSTPAGGPR